MSDGSNGKPRSKLLPLAPALQGPGLRRIVAIKSAQLVVLRRRRKLIWIQRVDTRHSHQPAEQAAREIGIVGGNKRRSRRAAVGRRCRQQLGRVQPLQIFEISVVQGKWSLGILWPRRRRSKSIARIA